MHGSILVLHVPGERLKEIIRQYYLRWLYFPLGGVQPDYFQKPWRYPTFALTEETIRSAIPAGSRSPSFLFLPMSDWHARLQRPQHLASALATDGHVCYFLNPHLGRQFPTVYPVDRRPRLVDIASGVMEVHLRLPAEPVYHHRILTAPESAALAEAFNAVAAAAGGPIVQVLSFPTWGALALQLRQRHGWPIVYDCHDFLAGFTNVAQDVVEAELPLLEEADHVLFSSMWLEQSICSRVQIPEARRSLLRNAVPRRFLDACGHSGESRQPKTAGYFGALDKWFDIEAVRRAAESHPDVRFRLIGRVEHPPILALTALSNVEFTGEAPYDQLPAFLMGFDVGLIPFAINDLTRAANPIKLYEYFAAGIPVVSTRLPEVERYEKLVYVADDAESFAQLVGAALSEQNRENRAARRTAAATETWEDRAQYLLHIAGAI